MYLNGIIAILLLLFAVLLMLGVVPMTNLVVGGMFLAVCLGFAGPYFIKA